MLILTLIACSNVNERAWSGGGTHYSSGEMYNPTPSDTGDTAGGDTATTDDTGDTSGTADLVPVGMTCDLYDMPNVGDVIDCTTVFSADDAPLMEGGSVSFHTIDEEGNDVSTASLEISELADGTASALLDGTNVDFFIMDIDTDASYTIQAVFQNSEGAESDELVATYSK